MDFNLRVNVFRKALSKTNPYHFTTLENLESILKKGKLLSKNSLMQNGINFYDIGDLEEDEYEINGEIGRRFKIFDIDAFGDENTGRIEFKYCSKVLSLKDYVRLYLFMIKLESSPLLVPRFLFLKILKWNEIVILLFVDTLKLVNYLESKGVEYYIIYGHPHRKNPSAFSSLDSFVKYLALDLPGIDTLKEWLKVGKRDILNMDLELRSEFFSRYTIKTSSGTSVKPCLSQLLASELIIKDELDLKETLKTIVVFGKDTDLKRRVEELCNQNDINAKVLYSDISQLKHAVGVKF